MHLQTEICNDEETALTQVHFYTNTSLTTTITTTELSTTVLAHPQIQSFTICKVAFVI